MKLHSLKGEIKVAAGSDNLGSATLADALERVKQTGKDDSYRREFANLIGKLM